MFDCVGGQRELTPSYIKELHAALLRHTETCTVVDQFGVIAERPPEMGEYKKQHNNPTRQDGSVHEYCPPEHLAAQMDRLAGLHHQYVKEEIPIEVPAAWLHHRFTQIYPFSDGNGRVARALATLVFLKAGRFPVAVRREDRADYLDVLEIADGGNLRPLIAFFVAAQRRATIQAVNLSTDIRPARPVEEAIEAAGVDLRKYTPAKPAGIEAVMPIASEVSQTAFHRLESIGQALMGKASEAATPGSFVMSYGGGGGFAGAKTAIAASGLTPQLSQFDKTAELTLSVAVRSALGVTIFAIGPEFRGFAAAIPYFAGPGGTAEGITPEVTKYSNSQIR